VEAVILDVSRLCPGRATTTILALRETTSKLRSIGPSRLESGPCEGCNLGQCKRHQFDATEATSRLRSASPSRLDSGPYVGSHPGGVQAAWRLPSWTFRGCVLGSATTTILTLRRRRQGYDPKTRQGGSLGRVKAVFLGSTTASI
jgi:hypothetical protein